jgi:hypothetical protein
LTLERTLSDLVNQAYGLTPAEIALMWETVAPHMPIPPPVRLSLRCPVCQGPMRVIAVMDDPRLVERFLWHLGAWHEPGGLSPPRAAGPYSYEPCDDVAPTPDYENALTD